MVLKAVDEEGKEYEIEFIARCSICEDLLIVERVSKSTHGTPIIVVRPCENCIQWSHNDEH